MYTVMELKGIKQAHNIYSQKHIINCKLISLKNQGFKVIYSIWSTRIIYYV